MDDRAESPSASCGRFEHFGITLHGMLGYDRADAGAVEASEEILLRLDYAREVPVNFEDVAVPREGPLRPHKLNGSRPAWGGTLGNHLPARLASRTALGWRSC